MSGARFLPKFVDANAATPSSILALTVLTLEPTLSIKGGFCFPLPCREKRKHNVDHLRNPLENTFIKAQDVFAGEVSRDDNRGVSRKDKKFGKLCEAQCEEFHDLIKNLEANSNLPPHLYPLVTQCKKDFLKASGWYLVREDDQGNLSRRKNSEVKKSMFIGKTSLPDATLTRLGEYVAAIKGSENIGNNKRVLQVHMSKVGIKKWLNDVGSHARIARALLSIAEGKSDAKLRKVAKQVDAKLGTTYLQLYEDAQQDAELHIDDDGTSEVNRYQDRRSSKSQRSSTPRSQGSDTDGQPIRSSKISTPGSRESDSRRVSSASCQNQPVASSVSGSQEGSRVSGSGSMTNTIEITTDTSERQLILYFCNNYHLIKDVINSRFETTDLEELADCLAVALGQPALRYHFLSIGSDNFKSILSRVKINVAKPANRILIAWNVCCEILRKMDPALESFKDALNEALAAGANDSTAWSMDEYYNAVSLVSKLYAGTPLIEEFIAAVHSATDADMKACYAKCTGEKPEDVDINAAHYWLFHHLCATVLATVIQEGPSVASSTRFLELITALPCVPWQGLRTILEANIELMRMADQSSSFVTSDQGQPGNDGEPAKRSDSSPDLVIQTDEESVRQRCVANYHLIRHIVHNIPNNFDLDDMAQRVSHALQDPELTFQLIRLGPLSFRKVMGQVGEDVLRLDECWDALKSKSADELIKDLCTPLHEVRDKLDVTPHTKISFDELRDCISFANQLYPGAVLIKKFQVFDSDDVVKKAYALASRGRLVEADIHAAHLWTLHHLCAAVLATAADEISTVLGLSRLMAFTSATPFAPWRHLIPTLQKRIHRMAGDDQDNVNQSLCIVASGILNAIHSTIMNDAEMRAEYEEDCRQLLDTQSIETCDYADMLKRLTAGIPSDSRFTTVCTALQIAPLSNLATLLPDSDVAALDDQTKRILSLNVVLVLLANAGTETEADVAETAFVASRKHTQAKELAKVKSAETQAYLDIIEPEKFDEITPPSDEAFRTFWKEAQKFGISRFCNVVSSHALNMTQDSFHIAAALLGYRPKISDEQCKAFLKEYVRRVVLLESTALLNRIAALREISRKIGDYGHEDQIDALYNDFFDTLEAGPTPPDSICNDYKELISSAENSEDFMNRVQSIVVGDLGASDDLPNEAYLRILKIHTIQHYVNEVLTDENVQLITKFIEMAKNMVREQSEELSKTQESVNIDKSSDVLPTIKELAQYLGVSDVDKIVECDAETATEFDLELRRLIKSENVWGFDYTDILRRLTAGLPSNSPITAVCRAMESAPLHDLTTVLPKQDVQEMDDQNQRIMSLYVLMSLLSCARSHKVEADIAEAAYFSSQIYIQTKEQQILGPEDRACIDIIETKDFNAIQTPSDEALQTLWNEAKRVGAPHFLKVVKDHALNMTENSFHIAAALLGYRPQISEEQCKAFLKEFVRRVLVSKFTDALGHINLLREFHKMIGNGRCDVDVLYKKFSELLDLCPMLRGSVCSENRELIRAAEGELKLIDPVRSFVLKDLEVRDNLTDAECVRLSKEHTIQTHVGEVLTDELAEAAKRVLDLARMQRQECSEEEEP
eukprot:Blabericola_migrator_1__4621@NODE_244_length_10915_cov_46_014012_g206_i0_p1_GENE_NODE_244_length_10915_cov_46_014012_g206_i0NODE_244_length_10915_cov_46_014012_g206_i0_p1_ORF_typecomplete_len1585_score304_99Sec7_N/PF12783_7/8_3Sec7_N/PF12783_7/6_9RseA_N/PF03872_13/2_2e02RseA_N/PF03872_13/1_4RseA_N/PF03872_13/5_4e03Pro_Al_protease/PF02983_14/3_9e03Pro_Al_protease/PF02983_14/0_71_NODE_244_length_10915_cov_46_014012_g206_i024756